jgi:hypothetical protein
VRQDTYQDINVVNSVDVAKQVVRPGPGRLVRVHFAEMG